MKKEFTRGFSLVEVLVVLVIMGVVVGAAYALFTLSNKTYRNQDRVVVMQQNARGAIEMLTQELRMAGYYNNPDPPVTADFGILIAEQTRIQFSQDLNVNFRITGNDGNPEPNEVVTYDWVQDENLLRRSTNWLPRNANPPTNPPPQNFADNITTFNLQYFRINNNALTLFVPDATTLNQIRLVRVTIQAESEVPGATGGLGFYTLTTDVGLRNIAVRD